MSGYDHDKVLSHWEDENVESMYDKHLLRAEIDLIRSRLSPGSKILDAGCGEGEGTLAYASIPGVRIHAVDFSETRLRKAKDRLRDLHNVELKRVDFSREYQLDSDFDAVVCQRFLINITDWSLQQKILLDLMGHLRKGGRLIMLEGSLQGVAALNEFRSLWNLPPIPVQWHNLFFDEHKLVTFMKEHDFELVDEDGLGAYFMLTRGVRPTLEKDLAWNSDFNRAAADRRMSELLGLGHRFSRLKLWAFLK